MFFLIIFVNIFTRGIHSLISHLKFECGVNLKLFCIFCKKYFRQPCNFKLHMGVTYYILFDT